MNQFNPLTKSICPAQKKDRDAFQWKYLRLMLTVQLEVEDATEFTICPNLEIAPLFCAARHASQLYSILGPHPRQATSSSSCLLRLNNNTFIHS